MTSELDSESADTAPAAAVRVKELRESPRRPGRYLLTLSDGRRLLLGAGALGDAGATRVGVELSADVLSRLEREAAITELGDRALGYMARGRRTRRELELRLRKRQPDPVLVREALDRLERSGLLSDTEVARAEAAARLRRGDAPARVRQTLRQKGVSETDARSAVSEAVEMDGFDEMAACRTAAEKRMRALTKLDPAVARRRLAAFLGRRGFGHSAVQAALAAHFRGGHWQQPDEG